MVFVKRNDSRHGNFILCLLDNQPILIGLCPNTESSGTLGMIERERDSVTLKADVEHDPFYIANDGDEAV